MAIVTLTKVILRVQRMYYSPGPFNLLIYFKVKKMGILYCKGHNYHYFYID